MIMVAFTFEYPLFAASSLLVVALLCAMIPPAAVLAIRFAPSSLAAPLSEGPDLLSDCTIGRHPCWSLPLVVMQVLSYQHRSSPHQVVQIVVVVAVV